MSLTTKTVIQGDLTHKRTYTQSGQLVDKKMYREGQLIKWKRLDPGQYGNLLFEETRSGNTREGRIYNPDIRYQETKKDGYITGWVEHCSGYSSLTARIEYEYDGGTSLDVDLGHGFEYFLDSLEQVEGHPYLLVPLDEQRTLVRFAYYSHTRKVYYNGQLFSEEYLEGDDHFLVEYLYDQDDKLIATSLSKNGKVQPKHYVRYQMLGLRRELLELC